MRVQKAVYALLLLTLTLSPLAMTGAQQEKSATKPSATAKAGPGSVKLTGCIKEGASANQYILKATDGKTYQLSAQEPSVDPSWHVGSNVTITGTAASDPTHLTVKSLNVNETYCP